MYVGLGQRGKSQSGFTTSAVKLTMHILNKSLGSLRLLRFTTLRDVTTL
jgi:hypothetical protein